MALHDLQTTGFFSTHYFWIIFASSLCQTAPPFPPPSFPFILSFSFLSYFTLTLLVMLPSLQLWRFQQNSKPCDLSIAGSESLSQISWDSFSWPIPSGWRWYEFCPSTLTSHSGVFTWKIDENHDCLICSFSKTQAVLAMPQIESLVHLVSLNPPTFCLRALFTDLLKLPVCNPCNLFLQP